MTGAQGGCPGKKAEGFQAPPGAKNDEAYEPSVAKLS